MGSRRLTEHPHTTLQRLHNFRKNCFTSQMNDVSIGEHPGYMYTLADQRCPHIGDRPVPHFLQYFGINMKCLENIDAPLESIKNILSMNKCRAFKALSVIFELLFVFDVLDVQRTNKMFKSGRALWDTCTIGVKGIPMKGAFATNRLDIDINDRM